MGSVHSQEAGEEQAGFMQEEASEETIAANIKKVDAHLSKKPLSLLWRDVTPPHAVKLTQDHLHAYCVKLFGPDFSSATSRRFWSAMDPTGCAYVNRSFFDLLTPTSISSLQSTCPSHLYVIASIKNGPSPFLHLFIYFCTFFFKKINYLMYYYLNIKVEISQ